MNPQMDKAPELDELTVDELIDQLETQFTTKMSADIDDICIGSSASCTIVRPK